MLFSFAMMFVKYFVVFFFFMFSSSWVVQSFFVHDGKRALSSEEMQVIYFRNFHFHFILLILHKLQFKLSLKNDKFPFRAFLVVLAYDVFKCDKLFSTLALGLLAYFVRIFVVLGKVTESGLLVLGSRDVLIVRRAPLVHVSHTIVLCAYCTVVLADAIAAS